MLAGKLHAILSRKYTKGRDLYDLAWYLSDPEWPAPNLVLLNHALEQTGWNGPAATVETWRGLIRKRLDTVDWDQARRDVSPFLERKRDIDYVSENTIRPLLQG